MAADLQHYRHRPGIPPDDLIDNDTVNYASPFPANFVFGAAAAQVRTAKAIHRIRREAAGAGRTRWWRWW